MEIAVVAVPGPPLEAVRSPGFRDCAAYYDNTPLASSCMVIGLPA